MDTAGADGQEARGPEFEQTSDVADPGLEDLVSQHLICPISHRVMDYPVISPSGHTYDRSSIVEWLSRRPVDPLSLTLLAVSSLYPNRALQNEIVDQLERLVVQAVAANDVPLADAARAKLGCVQAAIASEPACVEIGVLDKAMNNCACWATWCGIIAWEQILVFTTSFGALLCLALDLSASLKVRKGVIGGSVSRQPPLLATFVRLAVFPMLAPPRHWRFFGRLTVIALRGVLLLPVAPICFTLTLGSLLSLTRFAQRCTDVRAVESEKAAQSRWFVRTLHTCNAITGLSSFGLFMRLYWDTREGRLK